MILRKTIMFAIVLFLLVPVMARETLKVAFDRTFYLSGEKIWYEVYFTDSDTSGIQSKVVHVELLDPEGEQVVHQKLKRTGKSAAGMMEVPVSADEGFYLFRVYTHHGLMIKGYFSREIPVYSEWLDRLPATVAKDSILQPEIPLADHDLTISMDRRDFSPRDTLTLVLTGESDASVSVVVLDSVLDASMNRNLHPGMHPFNTTDINGELPLQAETELLLEGMLTERETGEKVHSPVISVFWGERKRFLRARSDSGRVSIPLPDFYGSSTFQVFNLNPYQQPINNFRVTDVELPFPDYRNADRPPFTPEVASYILKARKRKKVRELFEITEPARRPPRVQQPVITEPDEVYDMSKYQNLKTLQEFMSEGVLNASFVRRDGKKVLRLYNREDRFTFPDGPWFIIDGVLTSREEDVLEVPFSDMREIRLYTNTSTIKKYFEHFLWRNGVVEVITREVRYKRKFYRDPNIAEVQGYTPIPGFLEVTPIPSDPAQPDLRNILYWESGISVNSKAAATVKVPLSDDRGTYVIVLQGVDKEGRSILKRAMFSVR